MRIGRTYRFHSGHHLPGYKGKCARPHGHSYVLEVVLEGQPKFEEGASDDQMLMDFADLDAIVESLLEKLDHYDLNEVAFEVLGVTRTTAEALVLGIGDMLALRVGNASGIGSRPYLKKVKLWETDKSYAEWWRDGE